MIPKKLDSNVVKAPRITASDAVELAVAIARYI
jgi:hypothetical protein